MFWALKNLLLPRSVARWTGMMLLSGAIGSTALAQARLPLIHSGVENIDIRNGDELEKGNWRLAPEYRPDIYYTNKIGQKVTFYTDKDSISYLIHPDSVYDFVILLQGKDSSFTRIQYQPGYLDYLKKAGSYSSKDTVMYPKFTYQDSAHAALKALRTGLRLDSIAGYGSETSRILHLMHWIHALIPHDGNHDNPEVKNAMSMISRCQQEGRGLNCRGLAIVLNECYLALGIPSRFITCMPKDSVFQDCHVINMVFDKDLDKWIWIDPTHDAYVMDETGLLLGPAEVRERLINGRPLILNPDANWNNRSSTTLQYYLYEYMAKNLYRIECPVHSEYNYETREKGKQVEYVELLPLEAERQTPKVSSTTNPKSGVTFKQYKTNNAEAFWAKPRGGF